MVDAFRVRLAVGDAEQQLRFVTEIRMRLGRPDYQPPEGGDTIAHWVKFGSHRPPSKPHEVFLDTRGHGSTWLLGTRGLRQRCVRRWCESFRFLFTADLFTAGLFPALSGQG